MLSSPLDGKHDRTMKDDIGRGMPSPPLDSTHGRITSSVACHNRPWTAHTVGRRRAWYEITALKLHAWLDYGGPHTVERRVAWHDIIALELHARADDIRRGIISYPLEGKHGRMTSGHTRSNDVRRGMLSYPLDGKHGRTTSGVTCYHRLWEAHTVERRLAWHYITAFGQHTRSNDVGRDMPTPPLDSLHAPLGSTHGRTTSSAAQTVQRRLALHDITALGKHTRPNNHERSNNVGSGMTSPPLDVTHGRTSLGHTQSNVIGRDMPSPPLDSIHAHTVERRRAWHAIIALGQHTRSNDVRRDMPSPPLDSTHDRTTLGMACHHHLWAAQMVERRRAWHAIVALGRQTRSNNLTPLDCAGRGMPSSPSDGKHGRMT
uniref:Uncharacterized protein n=1 Tax=Solanum lycopersicum TaxID=4081 RepID=A0A494G8R2_SOLLC